MLLCLDLSSTCTGYSKFSGDGQLLKYDRIKPDGHLDPLFRLHYVTTRVKDLYEDVDDLVIEGIFLGRFAGKANVTTFEYLAKLAGIKGTSQKAEVQLWVIREFKFASDEQIEVWQAIMEALNGEYLAQEITLNQFKYRAGILSEIIDEATGIGEDIADSIVLGKAYINGGKNDRPTE